MWTNLIRINTIAKDTCWPPLSVIVWGSHMPRMTVFFVYCVAAPVTNLDHMCRHNLDIKNMVQDENDIVQLYYIHQN